MPDTAVFPTALLILAPWPGHAGQAARLQAAWPGARLLGLAEAGQALQHQHEARLLVLAPPPLLPIAAALAAGQAPAAALQGWRAAVEPLLGLLRRQRRRVALILLEGPEGPDLAQAWTACADRLGLPGLGLPGMGRPPLAAPPASVPVSAPRAAAASPADPGTDPAIGLNPNPPPASAAGPGAEAGAEAAADPVLRLAAGALLHADAEALALAEELEASALWSPGRQRGGAGVSGTPGGTTGAAAGGAVAQPGPAPLIAALVQLRQESQLLREQIRLDAGLRRALGAQIEALVAERDTQAAAFHKAAQESAAQQGRLAALQQEQRLLEGYFDTAQQLAAEVGQLRGQLEESRRQAAWLGEEIQRIHRARSYRLMAPLRRLRGLVIARG